MERIIEVEDNGRRVKDKKGMEGKRDEENKM